MIEAVFSLSIEKTGEPTINQMYLNNEKYNNIRISQSMMPPTVNRKPIQLSWRRVSHTYNPVSFVSHSMAALADFEKKYMLTPNRMA